MRQSVTILLNEFDEYEVPTGGDKFLGAIYYTADRDDAEATAREAWGDSTTVVFTTGSYAHSEDE